jgi:hypothetical protein
MSLAFQVAQAFPDERTGSIFLSTPQPIVSLRGAAKTYGRAQLFD